MPSLHRDDPHVDAVLAHRLGEDPVELLAPDLAEARPAVARLEVRLRAEGERGGETAERGEEQSAHEEGMRAP
jgi:hypothetical protein